MTDYQIYLSPDATRAVWLAIENYAEAIAGLETSGAFAEDDAVVLTAKAELALLIGPDPADEPKKVIEKAVGVCTGTHECDGRAFTHPITHRACTRLVGTDTWVYELEEVMKHG